VFPYIDKVVSPGADLNYPVTPCLRLIKGQLTSLVEEREQRSDHAESGADPDLGLSYYLLPRLRYK